MQVLITFIRALYLSRRVVCTLHVLVFGDQWILGFDPLCSVLYKQQALLTYLCACMDYALMCEFII
jgi:hypothetical protein